MYSMGIKTFFRDLGRKIKRGFNSFVSGAGDVIGKGATFLQQKAIPAIASGANDVAGLIGKASPLIDMAGPEASATAGEVADVAKQVGAGVGKFAKFIGSDIANKPPVVANAQQVLAFSQSPFGMAIRRSQGLKGPLDMAGANAIASGNKPAPAPAPAPMPNPNPLKMAGVPVKPLIGSNPATYTPSGIEAKTANQPIIKAVGSAPAGMLSM